MALLGLARYVGAFLGTLFVADNWWFEAFVVPAVAKQAPEIIVGSPGGSVRGGAVVTIVLFTAGWTIFGIAMFRLGRSPDVPPSC